MVDRASAKVLVVDDAAFMRVVLKDILSENGFENIFEAADGASAIAAFQKNSPDITTMDVNMPGVDGIQALRSILGFNPSAKVIMVTAVEQKHIVQEAIKLGARDYVIKPFDRVNVSTVINRVLKGA